ncbi:MAG: hypothetical protein AB7K52_02560 [Phycisphaerales bacterium]
MNRVRAIMGVLIGVATCAVSSPARGHESPSTRAGERPQDAGSIPVPDLEAKLAALTPSNPVGYFRLGEEVAEERLSEGARELARRLYVLAFHLDVTSAQPVGVGYSACLGLAALTNNQSEKRWLRALAAQVDPTDPDSMHRLERVRADAEPISERSALQIATALGLIRAAEGRRALRLLDRPGHWAIVDEHEGILGAAGASLRVRSLAEQWNGCPECHNRRVLIPRDGSGTATLCPACGGIPGPRLSREELIGHLRLEASLLRGLQQSWSAQLLSDGGEPLRDPNPRDLAIRYRIDVEAVLWRNDRWVADPSRPKPPEAKPAEAPPPQAPAPPAAPGDQPPGGSTTSSG